MHWERLKPPPNLINNVIVILAMACLSLAAFVLGSMISDKAGAGIGIAATGVLLFLLAFLNRPEDTSGRGRGRS